MKGKTLIQIFMAENGRKGGLKSRRKLSKREARRIALLRWGRGGKASMQSGAGSATKDSATNG